MKKIKVIEASRLMSNDEMNHVQGGTCGTTTLYSCGVFTIRDPCAVTSYVTCSNFSSCTADHRHFTNPGYSICQYALPATCN